MPAVEFAKASISSSPNVAGTIFDHVIHKPAIDPFGGTEQLQAIMVVHDDPVPLRDPQPAMRVGRQVARYPARRRYLCDLDQPIPIQAREGSPYTLEDPYDSVSVDRGVRDLSRF